VTSDIESSEAKLAQAKQDLKRAQTDRSAAKDAIAEATAVREKEAAEYAAFKADAEANGAAVAKAITALENGMSGSFLQTPAASVVSRACMKVGLAEDDQQVLTAFLSQSSSYAPQSGEITGILKQMGDTISANLADATADEEKALSIFKGLTAAKAKEVEATTATVEAKTTQIGALGVAIVQMKEDLSDTEASLVEDQKFQAELKKSCSSKASEWDERSKTRAEELMALADTIKTLNDDDALDLFKKALPSPSLLQVKVSSRSLQADALSTVRRAVRSANHMDRPGLELLSLALAGKSASSGGFEKVIEMIDNMVDVLKKEQRDDADKKEYCSKQIDITDDKVKALNRDAEKTSNAIETAKESVATLIEEIAALTGGIKALDKSVAEATEQRKEENAEFKSLMQSDTAAKEVLAFAKNRLHQFYNPKLYKPAAFVQIQLHRSHKAAPSPPPETWDAYSTKTEESNGVVSMIDVLIRDLEKEMTEAKVEEKNSQSDYEEMMKDAAEKRTTDSKSVTSKSGAQAELESELQSLTQEKTANLKELMATEKYMLSLHSECDWLMQYFDVRKEARTDEIDSLQKAKAVLSGADYSLVQVRDRHFLSRAH